MAAPTFVAVGAWAVDTTGGASTTPTPPAHLADDILFVAALNASGSVMSTGTAGWTLIAQVDGTRNMAWWWKRATGAGTAGPTITASGTDQFALCYIIRGCKTTGDPFEDATTTGDGSTGEMTPDTAAIDTLANDRFALCSLVAHTNTTFISGNPPAGWTADSNQGTASGTGANSAIISKTQAAAGNVPSVEVGTYSANVVTAQLTLAFLPTVSAYTAAPTDTITLSDSPVKQVGAVKGDTLTLSDIEINTLILGLLLADTITLSDSDSEIIGLALTDSLVLSDARLSAIGLITADSLSLNDALSQLVGLVKADTLTLTDVATPVLIGAGGGLSLLLGDTIILSDAKVLGPLFFSVE